MYWYFEVIGKCVNFKGRSGRKEYWMFVLYYFIFGLAIILLDRFIMDLTGRNFMVISLIYSLTMLLPGIAVTIRRLHDIDKRGRMIFIIFLPLIGLIWLLILMMTKGSLGDNPYGPNQTV